MSNLAISFGNYWQGVVAERIDYAAVFYVDALFVLAIVLVIPFLKRREARAPRPVTAAKPVTAEA